MSSPPSLPPTTRIAPQYSPSTPPNSPQSRPHCRSPCSEKAKVRSWPKCLLSSMYRKLYQHSQKYCEQCPERNKSLLHWTLQVFACTLLGITRLRLRIMEDFLAYWLRVIELELCQGLRQIWKNLSRRNSIQMSLRRDGSWTVWLFMIDWWWNLTHKAWKKWFNYLQHSAQPELTQILIDLTHIQAPRHCLLASGTASISWRFSCSHLFLCWNRTITWKIAW